RLVRLGFDGEAQVIAFVPHIGGQDVERLAQPVEGGGVVLAGLALRTVLATPAHVGLRTEGDRELDVADDLADRVAPHVTAVGSEATVPEHRVAEQVGGDHRHGQTGFLQRGPEPLEDCFPLGGTTAGRDEVVVVEGDAVGAEVGEAADRFDAVQLRTDRLTEGVDPAPAHGPQAEGELVRGHGPVIAHWGVSWGTADGLVIGCTPSLSRPPTKCQRDAEASKGSPTPPPSNAPHRKEIRTCPTYVRTTHLPGPF